MKDILEQTRKKPFRGIQKRIADQLGIHPQTVNNALLRQACTNGSRNKRRNN
jgi:DNA-binding CsgD family transcriptional regulator